MGRSRGSRTNDRRDGRSRRGLLGALLVLASALVVAPITPSTVEAAITDAFSVRYSANTNGDIVIRGNSLLTCAASAACTTAQTGGNASNNDFTMNFIDVDADPTTRSSSSSQVVLPDGATVLFAGLYWSAYGSGTGTAPPTGTARNRLLLRAPGDAAYRTITADEVSLGPASGSQSYQSFADVTSIVNAAGSGTYFGGDIFSTSGASDRYGAWSLVIAVSAPTLPVRNLTVYDGYGTLQSSPTSDRTLNIPVSGFQTPPSGTVNTRLGAVVYEGDRGFAGDTFTLIRQTGATVPLSNGPNPADNAFNSTFTDAGVDVAGRNPGHQNLLGFDADVFSGNNLLQTSQTSATLRLTTTQETFFPGVVTFAVDLYAPNLNASKDGTVIDGDGQPTTGPGDQIEYVIDIVNDGDDNALDTILDDAIPLGTTFVPGSITVDGAPVTDAADADQGEVAGSNIVLRLGTGAGGAGGAGGSFAPGATSQVRFRVLITDANQDGAELINSANLRFRGAQTGLALTGGSSVSEIDFTAPRADLRITKSATPALVQRDGTPDVTWTLTVVNDGPLADPAVTVTDTLPAGFTPTSLPAGCTVAAGTVTCAVGALTVGATAVLPITGTLDAATPDPTTNSATVTGENVDPDPSDNTATADVAVNSPPVAVDDVAAVPVGDTSVTIPVLGNDDDPDGDPLTVTTASIAPPPHGTVVVSPDGSLVYTVTNPSFKGDEIIEYEVCDDRGGCATATATVSVPNAPPVAVDDSTGTTPGVPVSFDVRANDTDPNGDPLDPPTVVGPTPPGLVLQPDGSFEYTPPGGTLPGTVVTFTYEVCDDDNPAACDQATVTITVDGAAPIAADDSTTTPYETPVVIPASDLLGNDVDPNVDPLEIGSVTAGTGGTPVLNGDGTVTFTPAPGFTGPATFTYAACETTGAPPLCDEATVTVVVPNTPPVVDPDVAATPADTPITVPVTGNDTDAETAATDLAVTITTPPTIGSATVGADGQITVTPPLGYKGPITIGYTACDDDTPQLCAASTLTVDVGNAPPVAVDDARVTPVNQAISVPVTANDVDPNGDALVVTGFPTPPAFGTVFVDPVSGDVIYTPNLDATGVDTFTYTVCDNNSPTPACDEATVTVTIANQPPTAQPDIASAPHVAGSPTVIPIDVTANDTDPDGQPLTVTAVTQPGVGTVTIDPVTGEVVYTAPDGYVGTETFTYEVDDGSGGVSRTTVTVTVGNQVPVATPAAVTTTKGEAVVIDVLDGDSDPDGDALTVGPIVIEPTNGTVVVNDDGTVTYTPDAGFVGTDTFTYQACDPYGLCAPAEVTVTVVDQAPVADDDSATVVPAGTVDIDVRANDADPDGDPLGIPTIVTPPTTGTVTVDPNTGVVTFTAPPGAPAGPVTFTYEVCTTTTPTLCDQAVVTVTVTVTVDAAPVAVDDVGSVLPGGSTNIDVTSDDVDPNGDPLRPPTIVTPPSIGTAVVETDGTITYTAPPGTAAGTVVTFTYEVCSDTSPALCDQAVVSITVDDDPPVANDDDIGTTPSGTPKTIDPATLLGNDVDSNGDDLEVTAVTSGPGGTVTLDPATGQIVFTPDPGFTGIATFNYTVCEVGSSPPVCDEATVTITVTALDVPPSTTTTTSPGGGGTTPTTRPPRPPRPGGPLPSTGATVAAILAVAAGLIALGVTVRQTARRRNA